MQAGPRGPHGPGNFPLASDTRARIDRCLIARRLLRLTLCSDREIGSDELMIQTRCEPKENNRVGFLSLLAPDLL